MATFLKKRSWISLDYEHSRDFVKLATYAYSYKKWFINTSPISQKCTEISRFDFLNKAGIGNFLFLAM